MSDNEQFKFINTEDGSPSLRAAQPPFESMHSRAGAFAETLYVYEQVVEFVARADVPARYICVGLGLGYIEFMATAYHLALGTSHKLRLDSFEPVADLKEFLDKWLLGKNVPPRFAQAYAQIVNMYEQHFSLSSGALCGKLSRMRQEGCWRMHGALDKDTVFDQTYSGIFYDAFSTGTSPQLWQESFLQSFLNKAAAPKSAFATYAATGVLKRVLRQAGFTVNKKKGFSYKRECVFASRQT